MDEQRECEQTKANGDFNEIEDMNKVLKITIFHVDCTDVFD